MSLRRQVGAGVAALDREWLRHLAVLVAVAFAYLHAVLLDPDVLLYTDFGQQMDLVQQHYPWRYFLHESLQRGTVPFWYPHSFAGQPFLANLLVGFFYPPNVLYFLLPLNVAVNYSFLVLLVLAGGSMYAFLGRLGVTPRARLLGGAAFMLGAPLSTHVVPGHTANISGVALVPLVFLGFDLAIDRDTLFAAGLAGLVVAVQLLGGHVQSTYNTLLFVGVYAAFRTTDGFQVVDRTAAKQVVRVFGIAGLVSFLLSAVQLLPTAAFLPHTVRASGFTPETATIFPDAYRLFRLADLAIPNLGGGLGLYWTQSYSVGVVPLLLAAVALGRDYRRTRVQALVTIAGVALVLSAGTLTPVYGLYLEVVPLADLFRTPGKFTIFVAFGVTALGAVGLDRLQGDTLSRPFWTAATGLVAAHLAVVGGVLVGYGLLLAATPPGYDSYVPPRALMLSRATQSLLWTVGGIGVLAIGARRELDSPRFEYLLVAFVTANLLFFYVPLVQGVPAEAVFSGSGIDADGGRIYDANATDWGQSRVLNEETHVVRGEQSVGGYNPLHFGSAERRLHRLRTAPPPRREAMLDALNVTRVVAHGEGRFARYPVEQRRENYTVRSNEDALPRAFFVPASAVDERPNLWRPSTVDASRPLPLSGGPNHYTVGGPVPGDGYVVVSYNWYPYWRASADGTPVEPVRTESGLLAIPVSAGTEQVTLDYDPVPVKAGVAAFGLGIVTLGLLYGVSHSDRVPDPRRG